MRRIVIIFMMCLLGIYSDAQINYSVKVAAFSSGLWDEFSPVYYKEGIVFCSNQSSSSIVSYGDKRKSVFNIFYVPRKDSTKWKYKQLLAAEISTDVNDGPATFSENGDLMYYSRNNTTNNSLKNINDSTNKLGIYSAELKNGTWTNIKPFDYNNELYTFCTPSLSASGNRIYFSCDMPGGFGGLDIYYCDKKGNTWDKPVNLGRLVNTSQSEVFPFACKSGKLFFATDGKPGFGRKDLFYTLEINGTWIEPVHLDSAINSPYDDFGLVTNPEFENGYFSTNRNKTDDIFSFSLKPVDFDDCQTIEENNFCFTFYDEQQAPDTIPLIYEWDFGNGIKRQGMEVKHCFPGSGDYVVKLSIRDKVTGETLVNEVEYEVSLKDNEQLRFTAYKVGVVNKPVIFDAPELKHPGYTEKYFWNFGNGYTPGAPVSRYSFSKEGNYSVKLGLLQMNDSVGTKKICVSEKIKIYNSYEEISSVNSYDNEVGILYEDSEAMQIRVYLMDDLSKEIKERIKKELSESGKYIKFNKFGIEESSFDILDKIVLLTKSIPQLRFAMAIHSVRDLSYSNSKKNARELAFFFNQKGIDKVKYAIDGFGNTQPLFVPYSSEREGVSGVIELMFMKE